MRKWLEMPFPFMWKHSSILEYKKNQMDKHFRVVIVVILMQVCVCLVFLLCIKLHSKNCKWKDIKTDINVKWSTQ